MRTNGDDMGRFAIDVEIANNVDVVEAEQGHLDPKKVRRKTIKGVVDSGAAALVLPGSLVKELGLPTKGKKIRVKYADGTRKLREEVGQVELTLLGRDGLFNAIVEPKRETALIGAIVLEALDLLVDARKQRLFPRDPDYIVSEIE